MYHSRKESFILYANFVGTLNKMFKENKITSFILYIIYIQVIRCKTMYLLPTKVLEIITTLL